MHDDGRGGIGRELPPIGARRDAERGPLLAGVVPLLELEHVTHDRAHDPERTANRDVVGAGMPALDRTDKSSRAELVQPGVQS